MVRSVLLDQSSIEDVLQEAFTRVLQSRKHFSDQQEAFHYLRRTVLTTTIDVYRRSKRQTSKISDSPRPAEKSIHAVRGRPDPLELLILKEEAEERRQLINHVRSAVNSLPKAQREAIELFFNRSKRVRLKDICQDSGIPYSTLRSRMIRGVDTIRLYLCRKGVAGFSEQQEEVKER